MRGDDSDGSVPREPPLSTTSSLTAAMLIAVIDSEEISTLDLSQRSLACSIEVQCNTEHQRQSLRGKCASEGERPTSIYYRDLGQQLHIHESLGDRLRDIFEVVGLSLDEHAKAYHGVHTSGLYEPLCSKELKVRRE